MAVSKAKKKGKGGKKVPLQERKPVREAKTRYFGGSGVSYIEFGEELRAGLLEIGMVLTGRGTYSRFVGGFLQYLRGKYGSYRVKGEKRVYVKDSLDMNMVIDNMVGLLTEYIRESKEYELMWNVAFEYYYAVDYLSLDYVVGGAGLRKLEDVKVSRNINIRVSFSDEYLQWSYSGGLNEFLDRFDVELKGHLRKYYNGSPPACATFMLVNGDNLGAEYVIQTGIGRSDALLDVLNRGKELVNIPLIDDEQKQAAISELEKSKLELEKELRLLRINETKLKLQYSALQMKMMERDHKRKDQLIAKKSKIKSAEKVRMGKIKSAEALKTKELKIKSLERLLKSGKIDLDQYLDALNRIK